MRSVLVHICVATLQDQAAEPLAKEVSPPALDYHQDDNALHQGGSEPSPTLAPVQWILWTTPDGPGLQAGLEDREERELAVSTIRTPMKWQPRINRKTIRNVKNP